MKRKPFNIMKTIGPPFRLSRKVRARQIVVADGEEAIQILKRLKKGESFEKVAMEKSLGPEKVQGGDLGYFSQGEKPSRIRPCFYHGGRNDQRGDQKPVWISYF